MAVNRPNGQNLQLPEPTKLPKLGFFIWNIPSGNPGAN
jgi:hypothetical protein